MIAKKMHPQKTIDIKNEFWLKTAKILYKQGRLDSSLFYLESEDSYFDLVALFFIDEEGYRRELYIPYPILLEFKSPIARKVLKMIAAGIPTISRYWHDSPLRPINILIEQGHIPYYPPDPEPEEYNLEEPEEE